MMEGAEDPTVCSFNSSSGYATPDSPCYLTPQLSGEKDALALTRIVASSLSIMGSAGIVVLVTTKRKACNTKIQPILILSLADFLLAVMWIIGSTIWLKAPQGVVGDWCIGILVLTVIFELVTVNVTLVYALVVHAIFRHQGSAASLMGSYRESIKIWHPLKTVIAYGFAWFEPFFVVLLMLGLFDSATQIVQEAKECSCWCVPFYGNVVPIPPMSKTLIAATNDYSFNLRKFILSISLVIGIHYLIVFTFLVIIYVRILLRLRVELIKRGVVQSKYCNLQYGSVPEAGGSPIPRTILLFLTLFVVTGTANFILSLWSVGVNVDPSNPYPRHLRSTPLLVLSLLQSLVLPLQGFLNAIVYGWTNEDFVDAVIKSSSDTSVSPPRGRPPSLHRDLSTSELVFSDDVTEHS